MMKHVKIAIQVEQEDPRAEPKLFGITIGVEETETDEEAAILAVMDVGPELAKQIGMTPEDLTRIMFKGLLEKFKGLGGMFGGA